MSTSIPPEPAFQDAFHHLCCFGCGPDNSHGLRIKSRWASPGVSVCSFTPEPFHCAGPPNVLNGGIIATLIDCHCVCTAMAAAYERDGRALGSEPHILYATASLAVRYLRPTPLGTQVSLEARIRTQTERKTVLDCTVAADGTPRAEGEVVAVLVPSSWNTSA